MIYIVKSLNFSLCFYQQTFLQIPFADAARQAQLSCRPSDSDLGKRPTCFLGLWLVGLFPAGFALPYFLSLFNSTLLSRTLLLIFSWLWAWSTALRPASFSAHCPALLPGQHREPASRPRSLHCPWLTAAERNATEKGFYLFSGEHAGGRGPFVPPDYGLSKAACLLVLEAEEPGSASAPAGALASSSDRGPGDRLVS